jgi:hypothetical protein
MFDVPGPHFALSELLIVLAGTVCAVRFGKAGMSLGAAGSLLFGVIAAIGAFRFGSGEMDALAAIHQAFSQIGGAIAMSLISGQLLMFCVPARPKARLAIYGAVIASALVIFLVPGAAMPLFLIWLVFAIAAAALLPARTAQTRIIRALLVGIFLINIIAIRQSPQLGVGLSWHIFHILVAVWLFCVSRVIFGPRIGRNS